jgi:hypothetical protein
MLLLELSSMATGSKKSEAFVDKVWIFDPVVQAIRCETRFAILVETIN